MTDFPGMAVHLPELNEDLAEPSDLSIEHVEDVKAHGASCSNGVRASEALLCCVTRRIRGGI